MDCNQKRVADIFFGCRPWGTGKICGVKVLAEGVGFEPTSPFGETVFKTAAIDHSAIPPRIRPESESLSVYSPLLKTAYESFVIFSAPPM